jgi:ketosteroid isomerase-like protein
MSEENVEVVRGVRIPLTVSSKARRRSHLERILVRFPVLFRLLAFAWSRLPPRSRLRGRLTAHLFRQGHEAANRRDFEVLLLSLDPEIEFCTDESATSLIAPDLLDVHRGYEGYVHIWRAVMEAAEDARLEPEEVIDRGDRLLVTGRTTGRGTSSGVPYEEPLFQLFIMRRGLIIRQTAFADRNKAIEAAGLAE